MAYLEVINLCYRQTYFHMLIWKQLQNNQTNFKSIAIEPLRYEIKEIHDIFGNDEKDQHKNV